MRTSPPTIRLAVTADLHYGITDRNTIARLVSDIAAAECDVVCLAGDIGEPETNFRAALKMFATLGIPCGVVAGNHDVWANDYSSQELWDTVLPRITTAEGLTWLEQENLILGSLGICGTIGWYDYSAGDARLPHYTADRYEREKSRFNMDGERIDWLRNDREFAQGVLSGFRRRIGDLQDNSDISTIAVITHVPPFQEQVIRKPVDDFLWNVNNAYFGNLTLGEEIVRHDKTALVVSGHTHVDVDTYIHNTPLNNSHIHIVTIGSQYRNPRYSVFELPVTF